jgi:hypothetical protein
VDGWVIHYTKQSRAERITPSNRGFKKLGRTNRVHHRIRPQLTKVLGDIDRDNTCINNLGGYYGNIK